MDISLVSQHNQSTPLPVSQHIKGHLSWSFHSNKMAWNLFGL